MNKSTSSTETRSESSPSELRWVPAQAVFAIHNTLVRSYGGSYGTRDRGLVESAIARPRQNQDADLADLAASYGYGLTKNHGFVDGNKRIGLAIMAVFLQLNGCRLTSSEPEAVDIMRAVADNAIDEFALAQWVRNNLSEL